MTLKYKASNFNCNTIIIERDITVLFFHACEFSIIIVQFPDNSIFICFHREFKVIESNKMERLVLIYEEC